MKIYLAATAPGNEPNKYRSRMNNQLLSYFLVLKNQFESQKVFKHLKIIKYESK